MLLKKSRLELRRPRGASSSVRPPTLLGFNTRNDEMKHYHVSRFGKLYVETDHFTDLSEVHADENNAHTFAYILRWLKLLLLDYYSAVARSQRGPQMVTAAPDLSTPSPSSQTLLVTGRMHLSDKHNSGRFYFETTFLRRPLAVCFIFKNWHRPFNPAENLTPMFDRIAEAFGRLLSEVAREVGEAVDEVKVPSAWQLFPIGTEHYWSEWKGLESAVVKGGNGNAAS